MKTCKNCGIEVADEEIFCPKCGEMLLGCSVNNDAERHIGKNALPQQPDVMTVGDIVLGRRYGKRIIQTLRTISVIISLLSAGFILACGILCILGRQSFNLPPERRTFVGILALPISLIVGFLVYFIFNILITKYENISLIGRNTEAQLSLLENQSALISALIDAMNENNRRVDVIGEMLDDVLRIQERQARLLEELPSASAAPDTARAVHESNAEGAEHSAASAESAPEPINYEESFTLINENLCNAAANTLTMLKRVENAVNNGLGKLYKMFYSALNHGAPVPEEDAAAFAAGRKNRKGESKKAPVSAPVRESESAPEPAPAAETASAQTPEPASAPTPEPEPEHSAAPEAGTVKDEPGSRDTANSLDQMDTNSSGEIILGGGDEYDNGGYNFDSAQESAQADSGVSYLPTDSDQ